MRRRPDQRAGPGAPPNGDRHPGRVRGAPGERGGRSLAAVYAVLLTAGAVFFAVLAGLGSGHDVWLIARGLLISALSGVAAAGCALQALRRPLLSPLLALGLLPAVVQVVVLAAR